MWRLSIAGRSMVTVSFTLLMTSFFRGIGSLPVNGCPMFGCRPSGTFCFDLDISEQVALAWPKSFKQPSTPEALGCVGNGELIVCQGDGKTNRGYVGLVVENGSLAWSDKVLHRPSLPIMDVFGDIVGTDGRKLVMYEADGTLVKPVIQEKDLSPVFSITFSDNNIFAMVSKRGQLVTVEANGVPHAYMEFRGWEERVNGTFIPIAPPVVFGHRIYILTAFRPDDKKSQLSLQRLYAVDIFNTLSGKLKVAWYFNFEKLSPKRPNFSRRHDTKDSIPAQILMNTDTGILYINLPPLQNSEDGLHVLWALKDELNTTAPTLLFKTPQPVSQIAMYESGKSLLEIPMTRTYHGERMPNREGFAIIDKGVAGDDATLWAVSTDKKIILGLSPHDGTVWSQILLKNIFNMTATVTSRIMVAKSASPPNRFLIFGIEVDTSNDNSISETFKNLCSWNSVNPYLKYYVVCIQLETSVVHWVKDTPNQYPVIGQITGIKRTKGKGSMLVCTTNGSEDSEIFALIT